MSSSYWSRYHLRANRRKFLGGSLAASAGVAALALAGCGDDDDDTIASLATPTPDGSATTVPADPFAGAKRGGTMRLAIAADPPSLDPYVTSNAITKGNAQYVYSRLYKNKTKPGLAQSDVAPGPDLAESLESTPDGLVWTAKLRPDAKFHNIAPVSGRAVTSDDVRFSWARLNEEKLGQRAQVDFVDKVEYPDAQTIKFTLKAPFGAFRNILADGTLLLIQPGEADGKFDPKSIQIGSGAWMWDSYEPNTRLKYKKNPEWVEKGYPFFDAIDLSVIPEYANRLAQFRGGSLDSLSVEPLDVIDARKQIKGLQFSSDLTPSSSIIFFESDPNSPWQKDERIRQAISMAQDRNALTELAYENKKLIEAGIDAKTQWNNVIPVGHQSVWLDPQGGNAGDGAKFFKYDLAEAKKLIEAAGATGLEVKYQYSVNAYPLSFAKIAEATIDYLQQIGLKLTVEIQDYATVFGQTRLGNFKGIANGIEAAFPEPGGLLTRAFTVNPQNKGKVNDPVLLDLTLKQRQELDVAKRREIFHEIQRYHATKMYYVPGQYGAGLSWTIHQPWMRMVTEIRTIAGGTSTAQETLPYRWSDNA